MENLGDIIVNKLLNEEESKAYVLRIMNFFLKKEKVKDYVILSRNVSNSKHAKQQEVDFLALLPTCYFNMETNMVDSEAINRKNFLYIDNVMVAQLKKGEEYKKVLPVIQVCIDHFDYYKQNKLIYVAYHMERESHIDKEKLYKVYHVNMDKLSKVGYNHIKKYKKRDIEYLLYVLICPEKEIKELYEGDEVMLKIAKRLEQIKKYPDVCLVYDREKLAKEVVIEQGEERGKIQTTNEVAKMMIKNKESKEKIQKYTGLSLQRIKELEEM